MYLSLLTNQTPSRFLRYGSQSEPVVIYDLKNILWVCMGVQGGIRGSIFAHNAKRRLAKNLSERAMFVPLVVQVTRQLSRGRLFMRSRHSMTIFLR